MPCKTPAEWLSKLPLWDGTPRLARWLTTYLGAVDTPYTRLVSRLFIIGMIARALNPGVKFDYCIVLEGSQGIGKSEALRILGGKWFSDSAFDLSNRDAMAALRGKWLYEFSELGRTTRADARTKSFIERTFDEFRPLYEKRPVRLYRQCVFVGTTNEYKWRMDEPDVRNFLPVHCSRIDIAGLKADRKQLFSEALAAYTLLPDVLFDLTVEYTAATAPRIDSAHSSLVDTLKDWVESQTAPFSITDAAVSGLQLDAAKVTRDLQTRIGNALRKLGCKKAGFRAYYVFQPDNQPTPEPHSLPSQEKSPSATPPTDRPPHRDQGSESVTQGHQPDDAHPTDQQSPQPADESLRSSPETRHLRP